MELQEFFKKGESKFRNLESPKENKPFKSGVLQECTNLAIANLIKFSFLGSTPYPGLSANEVIRRIRDGYRLEKPDHCRREMYNIMFYCWDKDPKLRPNFSELVSLLDRLLESEHTYIELERFPDHSYYNITDLSGEKL